MITWEELEAANNGEIKVLPFTYKNSKAEVNCVCPTHGPFARRIDRLKEGRGCSQCGLDKAAKSRRFTPEMIREHIPVKYEIVSLIGDKLSTATVVLRCPEHGVLAPQNAQKAGYHPCKLCGYEKCGEYLRGNTASAVAMFKKVHGDTYDYSKVVYKSRLTPVDIVCRLHGVFSQTPNNHSAGQGCPACGKSGFKTHKPAQLYMYKMRTTRGDEYIGFGITNKPATRHQQHRKTFREAGVKVKLAHTFEFPYGHMAHACEQSLKLLGNVDSGVYGFYTEALPMQLEYAAVAIAEKALREASAML